MIFFRIYAKDRVAWHRPLKHASLLNELLSFIINIRYTVAYGISTI